VWIRRFHGWLKRYRAVDALFISQDALFSHFLTLPTLVNADEIELAAREQKEVAKRLTCTLNAENRV